MTSTNRERLLRRLEQASHVLTTTAFVLTILLVTTGKAAELNVVATALFSKAGWAATGVAAIATITAVFAYYERYVDDHPRLILGAGAAVAILSGVDLGVNVYVLAVAGWPETIHGAVYAPPAALVASAGLLAMGRRHLTTIGDKLRQHSPSAQKTAAIAFALLLVLSGVGPFASFGGLVVEDHNGTASADTTLIDDFEDGDHDGWTVSQSNLQLNSDNPLNGSYSLEGDTNTIAERSFTAASPSEVSFKYHHNAGTDDRVRWGNGSAVGPWLKFDSTIRIMADGGETDTGISATEPVTIRLTNISYTNNTYDLVVEDLNGTTIGTYSGASFDQNIDSLSLIEWWYADSGDLIDDIRLGAVPEQTGPSATGQALDQNGDPVSNATVVASYDGKDVTEVLLDGKPYDELQNDPTKNLESWQDQLDNLSVEEPSNAGVSEWYDHLEAKDDARVVSHTGEDWNREGTDVAWLLHWRAESTKELPALTLREPTVVYDSDETVMLSVWEGTGTGLGTQDGLDQQLPGRTQPGNITVERVDPLGDTKWSETYETRAVYRNRHQGNLGWSDETGVAVKNHHAVGLDLDPGMYRVSPEASDITTVIVVTEDGDLDSYEAEIENWATAQSDSVSAFNDRAREKYSDLPVEVTQTNETGHYTLSPPSTAESADITVTKTGAEGTVSDPTSVTKQDLRDDIETTTEANWNDEVSTVDFDAAFDARNTDETFRRGCEDMQSVANDIGAPYYGDKKDVAVNGGDFDVQGDRILTNGLEPASQTCAAINFAEQLVENGLGSVIAGLPDDLSELTEAELRELIEPWLPLFGANPTLKDEVEERTGVTLDSENPEDYTRSDLETLADEGVGLVDDGTSNVPTGGNTGGGGIPTTDGSDAPNIGDGSGTVDETAETLSQAWPVANVDDWSEAALVIRITNGQGETVATLSQDSEYVTVDEGPGADTVTLDEYPIDGEAKAFSVEIDVVTPGGAGDNKSPAIPGPGLNGQIPETKHIRVSTLSPAAGESVSISAGGGPTFGSVEHVNVTKPDGTTTQYTATDGEASIGMGSAGDHRVAIAVSNAEGETITEVITVTAGTTSQGRPATIVADSGVTGRFAVVGNGFQSGSIETADGNSEVNFVGVFDGEPGPVSVHATDISAASDTTYSVDLRKGEDERAIESSPQVLLHMPTTDDEAIYWRNGRAIPKGEQGTEGTVQHRNESSVAETFYDADAGLEVRAVEDPGIIQSTRHWIDRTVPAMPFSVFGVGAVGLAVLPAGAFVGRRYL